MAIKIIECAHCGFKFKMDIGKLLEDGETTATRNIPGFLKPEIKHVKSIDIKCPKCEKIFEYKLES